MKRSRLNKGGSKARKVRMKTTVNYDRAVTVFANHYKHDMFEASTLLARMFGKSKEKTLEDLVFAKSGKRVKFKKYDL